MGEQKRGNETSLFLIQTIFSMNIDIDFENGGMGWG